MAMARSELLRALNKATGLTGLTGLTGYSGCNLVEGRDMLQRGLSTLGGSSSSHLVSPNASFDYQQFYEDNLRSVLIQECYQKMTPLRHKWDRYHYVTIPEITELYLRYPKAYLSSLWEEIRVNKIIAEDPTLDPHKSEPMHQPIEIIRPFLPPTNWDLFYTDASPNADTQKSGGGGIVRVTDSGVVTMLDLIIPCESSFVSEGIVMREAALYAQRLGLRRAIFVSDSLYLVEAVNGRRYVRELYGNLFRSVINGLSGLDEYLCFHQAREALQLADALARNAKLNQSRKLLAISQVPQPHHPRVRVLRRKLSARVPVLRLEMMKSGAAMSSDEIETHKRYSPHEEEKFYTEDEAALLRLKTMV